eukprot:3541631-Alexandrium_andersonii.AAC.1
MPSWRAGTASTLRPRRPPSRACWPHGGLRLRGLGGIGLPVARFKRSNPVTGVRRPDGSWATSPQDMDS